MFQDEAAKAFDAFKELNEKDLPEPEEPAVICLKRHAECVSSHKRLKVRRKRKPRSCFHLE
jgi:hypothetical protein